MACSLPGSSQRGRTRLSTEHTLATFYTLDTIFVFIQVLVSLLENQRKEREKSVNNSKLQQLIKMQFCNII